MNTMTIAQRRLTAIMHHDALSLNERVTAKGHDGFEVSGDQRALNGWTNRPAPDVLAGRLTHIPGSELYPTWPATDFSHYSAAELNDFHDTDGFDVTLPVSGDQTRLAA